MKTESRNGFVAADLTSTDYVLTPQNFEIAPRPQDVPLNDHTLGSFIGNGHASGGSVEFTFNSDSARAIKNCVEDLEQAGFNPKVETYKDRNATRVRVHDRELVRWCRVNLYTETGEKNYPEWLIGSHDVVDGLFETDGHNYYIDTTSLTVRERLISSLIVLRYKPTVHKCVRSKGTYDNAKDLWRIAFIRQKQKEYVWADEEFVCHPVVNVTALEGPAIVYDIGVESRHHSFLANGVAVHNCVSHGYGKGIENTYAIEIDLQKEYNKFPGRVATEYIYGSSRVLVGQGRLRNGDGSLGSWMNKAIMEHGVLFRQKYMDGKYDFTTYDGQKAKRMGFRDFPYELEDIADENPVLESPLVTSYEDARDSIANGYCVAVCSMQGFSERRDNEGFARPQGQWAHCMTFIAVDDAHRRPGLLCDNRSWGERWISGPTRHNQPEGTFWVDADTVNRMLRQQDSYAIANVTNFENRVDDLVKMIDLIPGG